MGSENQHLGNLDMGRGIGSKDGDIGNIIARQWLNAFIDICRSVAIAMETDVAEIRLDQARLQIGDTDGRIGHIDT